MLWAKIYMYCKFSVGFFEIVSAAFLAVGLYGLYKLKKKGYKDDRLNLPQLALHLGAFVTYLISMIVMFGFMVPYVRFDTPQSYINYVIADTVSSYVGMVSQLLTIAVLWPLTKYQDVAETKRDFDIPETVELTEDDEITIRVWWQIRLKAVEAEEN